MPQQDNSSIPILFNFSTSLYVGIDSAKTPQSTGKSIPVIEFALFDNKYITAFATSCLLAKFPVGLS